MNTCNETERFPTHRHFLMPLQQTTFENIVAKGEIAHDEQFLLLQQCFQFNAIFICLFLEISHMFA